VKHVRRVTEFLGMELDQGQIEKLAQYRDWLRDEAIPAGGLGPAEDRRLESRHIADSLLFAAGFGAVPEHVRDLGSGVGLPGIPLAVAHPRSQLELVDRSQKRADLMRRAVAVLDLGNVTVTRAEIAGLDSSAPVIVSRAAFRPEVMATAARRLLAPAGRAIVGGSWSSRPEVEGWETVEIPAAVLDQPVWLLIMGVDE